MPKIPRSQRYPYAEASTGDYREDLGRKYPCWNAEGPVRDMFTDRIAGEIKNCLEQCLPESTSFVGFSLFMVGKQSGKTKPTIMIVSDDKGRRKAAFQMVKAKNILAMYPGFELGHCDIAAEFKDLVQLGTDTEPSASILEPTEGYGDPQFIGDGDGPGAEALSLLSAEVCAFEYPDATTPTRLYFHISPHSHSHCASATCGGLFQFKDDIYALTMAHAIRPVHRAVASPDPWEMLGDSSSESDDFEITGMDNWDDDDEDGDTKTLAAITSSGSKTPSELSDSEECLPKRHDSQRSSAMSIRTRVTSAPSVIYEDDDCVAHSLDDHDDLPDVCEPIGSVVSIDHELDIALIKLKSNKHKMSPDFAHNLPDLWEKYRHTNDDLTHTSVMIKTTHHLEIRGRRSGTAFYTRFPGTSNFLELHSVRQLSASLRPGDSGSWAFDSRDELIGFVVAGNPNSMSCLLLPIDLALRSMSLLLHKWVLAKSLPLRRLSQNVFSGMLDDDTINVASSLPPPSLFSQRMDHGTPSTIAYSTTTPLYERKSNNPQSQGSMPRGNAKSSGGSVTTGDFLQDQVTKLRRKQERAWEIIQDKDKDLHYFIPDHLGGLGMSTKDTSPLQYKDHTYSPAYSSQGSAQTQHQPTPSESPKAGEARSDEGAEFPALSNPSALAKFEALRTELEANHRINEITTMWRTQVDANEALLQENAKLKRAIEQAIETTTDSVPVDVNVTGGDRLQRIASDLSEVLRGSDDMKPVPIMTKVKTVITSAKPESLYPRRAFQGNTLSSTRIIDKVVEEEDEAIEFDTLKW
ncbi:hypothetical protein GGR55DRAFT_685571 [Xylaria sp. FL0064]|nr:hypothetical protein GGR55DRAFT_685571 [Xylaria sp. FL0064]